MKSLLLIVLSLLVFCSSACENGTEKEEILDSTSTSLFYFDPMDGHKVRLELDLCSPCRKFFGLLKKVLEGVVPLTKEGLRRAMEVSK